jgi:hypothetical protein
MLAAGFCSRKTKVAAFSYSIQGMSIIMRIPFTYYFSAAAYRFALEPAGAAAGRTGAGAAVCGWGGLLG